MVIQLDPTVEQVVDPLGLLTIVSEIVVKLLQQNTQAVVFCPSADVPDHILQKSSLALQQLIVTIELVLKNLQASIQQADQPAELRIFQGLLHPFDNNPVDIALDVGRSKQQAQGYQNKSSEQGHGHQVEPRVNGMLVFELIGHQ